MKRILCSLLVATLPFGSVLAAEPKSKNGKATLVYQHELPNVPGKSIKGCSSNMARVANRPATRMPNHRSHQRKVLRPTGIIWVCGFSKLTDFSKLIANR
jgi:hypothetical protein